jgi:hypothetical protein
MKKLMLTTAIASVLTTAAIAQTTITGELRISYKDVVAPKGLTAGTDAATKNTSYGFGAEQQLNVQNKGKLSIGGLDYAAGFSIENDGEQSSTNFNENVFIDLTNSGTGTTVSFGRDHIQRSDSDTSATNLVGFTPNELSQTTNATNGGTRFKQNIGPATSQAYGAALLQKTPVGTFSYNWVPNNAAPAAVDAVGNGTAPTTNTLVGNAGSEAVNPNTTAAYEYGFVGDLSVKGLQAHYFKSENHDFAIATNTVKAEAKNYGVKYNLGQVTVAANKKKYNSEDTSLTRTTETAYAAAYAINKDLTVGVIMAKAENSNSAIDQKVKGINIGYALGPVDLAIGYAKGEDALSTTGADNDVFMARLIGKF